MHSPYIKLLEEAAYDEVGRKMASLKRVSEAGFRIPKTLVLTTALQDLITFTKDTVQIPDLVRQQILERIDYYFGDTAVVVRSSATAEDTPLFSFAGQYSSFLKIKSADEIINAIAMCYASLQSPAVRSYAVQNHLDLASSQMAVAIQEFVPSTVIGVLFTVDPLDMNNQHMIFEHAGASTTAAVSGASGVQTYFIDRSLTYPPTTLEHILQVIGLRLESIFGDPQDIEWGFANVLTIFQSRPVTARHRNPKGVSLLSDGMKIVARGLPICSGKASGKLVIVRSATDYGQLDLNDIAVLQYASVQDIGPLLGRMGGIILTGGILSHFAVLTREFNLPAISINDLTLLWPYNGVSALVDAINGTLYVEQNTLL